MKKNKKIKYLLINMFNLPIQSIIDSYTRGFNYNKLIKHYKYILDKIKDQNVDMTLKYGNEKLTCSYSMKTFNIVEYKGCSNRQINTMFNEEVMKSIRFEGGYVDSFRKSFFR